MKVIPTRITDVLIIEPTVYLDDRGFFFESWNEREFDKAGCTGHFVQDNHSRSSCGVLRGLHYQLQRPQGKLVRVLRGRVFDVAVDLRKSSPSFGRWVGTELSEHNHLLLWIPAGFAHGFIALSADADLVYKVTDYYAPEYEHCVIWNDPAIGIEWPRGLEPRLSAKDRAGVRLQDAEVFA
jgi:dTDP-4-dehydrorhamnose 3,5-epimerase